MSKDLEGHKTNTGHERVNEQKEGDNEGKGVWYTPHSHTRTANRQANGSNDVGLNLNQDDCL